MDSGNPTRRERLVLDTFVELADTLCSDYDVSEFLQFLVDRCAQLLVADTVGVLLETSEGRLELAAATSAEMEEIKAAELDAGQGPCMDAYHSGEPITVDELLDTKDRWPAVTWRLLDLGMRSGHAFPLHVRDDRIGALSFYRRRPGQLPEDDIRLGQAFADASAIGILQHRRVAAAEERADQLQHALDSRVLIEQAKGALAQHHGISTDQAFEVMRRHARSRSIPLRELCNLVTAGHADKISID